jgi:alpha-L-rhamnosidase
LDFGTNLSGWLKLELPGLAAGRKVVMRYADKRFQSPAGDKTPAGDIRKSGEWIIKTDGGDVAYQSFKQIDEFISAGKTGEQFCSKFNYHGFRYVIVEGLEKAPEQGTAQALLIESDLNVAGDFECSNDLFNRIHKVNVWTLRSLNLGGYMVDCPHRERLGYGDGQLGVESLIMSSHAPAFYAKWTEDWLDGQTETGDLPHTAPKQGGGRRPGLGWRGLCPAIQALPILWRQASARACLRADAQVCRVSGKPLHGWDSQGLWRPVGFHWRLGAAGTWYGWQ